MTCTRLTNGVSPNNAPAVLETPGGRSHLFGRCNVRDRTYCPDVESTPARPRGLPDSPEMEMGWSDVRCRGCGVAILVRHGDKPLCTRCRRGDEPPSPAALFPEIPTWSDEQLVVAIELADRREPGLNLYAVGDLPDRHEVFLDACSAELVRRMEERGVRFAA